MTDDAVLKTTQRTNGMKRIKVNGGLRLCSVLTIVFVTLRMCKVIDWSWWWVLAPLWGPWTIVAAVGAILFTTIVFAKVVMIATGRGR